MNESNSPARHRRSHSYLLVLITVILTGWALKATGTFMIPVVFSVILALLVAPLDRWVADRVPDKVGWLGRLAAMGTILVVLLGFAGLMWIAAEQTIERFPNPTERIPRKASLSCRNPTRMPLQVRKKDPTPVAWRQSARQ